MSLREMHEQQKQSSPREQLQELNRQSRTELENSLLKEALAMSSENCEELMKQSNQEQVRAEQNRQRDAEQNRKLISELKQSVELLKNSNELLQDAISGEIGSLKDEVKENTVQEVRKALQANIEAIQRATKLLEKQSDTLTSVMKQKIRELEESKNSFFRYEGLKLYLFWGGISELMQDDDVTAKKGIYEYLLSGDEKHLNIRAFTDNQKREAYERQKGICPTCKKHFEIDEMEGDHIDPWHDGGKTTAENCQMLCRSCNRRKSGK